MLFEPTIRCRFGTGRRKPFDSTPDGDHGDVIRCAESGTVGGRYAIGGSTESAIDRGHAGGVHQARRGDGDAEDGRERAHHGAHEGRQGRRERAGSVLRLAVLPKTVTVGVANRQRFDNERR